MIVGIDMSLVMKQPLAVCFDENLVLYVVELAKVSYQDILIKEFVENEGKYYLDTFSLHLKKYLDEMQQFVDFDVEKIFGTELGKMISFHQFHKYSTYC